MYPFNFLFRVKWGGKWKSLPVPTSLKSPFTPHDLHHFTPCQNHSLIEKIRNNKHEFLRFIQWRQES